MAAFPDQRMAHRVTESIKFMNTGAAEQPDTEMLTIKFMKTRAAREQQDMEILTEATVLSNFCKVWLSNNSASRSSPAGGDADAKDAPPLGRQPPSHPTTWLRSETVEKLE